MKQGKSEELIEQDLPAKKIILKLAWPVIAEQSLATITQIVDMMMVGRLGAAAVTSIGLTMQPLFFAQSLGAAIGVGATALVSRFVGKGEPEQSGEVLKQSIFVVFLLSLFSALIFYFNASPILNIMGGASDVVELGSSYMKILMPGYVFLMIGFIVSASLRGAGETKLPMKVNIMVNIINVIGNYLLIFGHFGLPAMGLNGAALATSVARGAGGLVLLGIVFTRLSIIRIPRKGFFRIDISLIKRILKIGIPTAMEETVRRFAQILFVRVIASLGTVSFAAHQIALNAESISYMPGFGIAVAATTLVGQNLGAKKPDQAEETTFEAWKIGMMIMGVMALIFLLIPEILVKLYTDDPHIIKMASLNLRIIAFSQLPMGTHFIFAGALRGAGDTKTVFYGTTISTWVFRLGLGYLLVHPLGMGLAGAWLAMVVDWIARGSYVLYKFKKGKWKLLEV